MALSKAQASTILTRLGWRVNTVARYNQAILNFQRGWNLGVILVADGAKGPKTDAALILSEARRRKGLGTASAHFSFIEVRCKCGGAYSECPRIWTPRRVFAALEGSRKRIGRSIKITSGCRCPRHNGKVGGAKLSKHRDGTAVDWTGPDKDTTRSWNIWRGIGYGARSDRSLHTDLRSVSTMWIYPGW